jgi:hypothetical protein
MTIQEIKEQFGFSTLMMVRQLTLSGQRTEWLSHWDNERRIRLSIHENIAELIKNNKAYDKLDYEVHEMEQKGERKPYTRITIMIEDNRWRKEREFNSSYENYNGAHGYDDDAIDNAFNGDPDNCWGITD